jgi:hypothetical protein
MTIMPSSLAQARLLGCFPMPLDYDEDEIPTRPDGPQLCPKCIGEDGRPMGYVLKGTWEGTKHRNVPVTCDLCGGRKLVGRERAEEFKKNRGY